MTTREIFKEEIKKSQRLFKRGAKMFISCLPLFFGVIVISFCYPSFNLLMIPISLVFVAGFLVYGYSMARLIDRIICPACGKRVHFLIINPIYSKKITQFGIPSDLPTGYNECPFCKLNFDEEIKFEPKKARRLIL